MAKKSFVGIDIGHDQIKLAWVKSDVVKTSVVVQIPENAKDNGNGGSNEIMSNLIRKTLLENGILEKKAAYVLSSDASFARNITMPLMNDAQLQYNLPYEFKDYFTEDIHDYAFDYAIYIPEETSDEKTSDEKISDEETMNLLGVAVHKNTISEIKKMLSGAGLRAEIIAPSISAYLNIIAYAERHGAKKNEEYCFIDLGNKTIRMYIFKGRRYCASREIERGIETIEKTIAEMFGVDESLAHNYLISNYQNCQESTACTESYGAIGIDILRALNFYQFSNPDSQLGHIYICGGGGYINPLMNVIKSTISEYKIHFATELIKGAGDACQQILAIAVAME